jgi:hypothetical protein
VTGDIVHEYLVALRATSRGAVCSLGISASAIRLTCPALTGITLDHVGELYRPDPAGRPAWVIPATAVDPGLPDLIETADPIAAVGDMTAVVDFVAFSPSSPGRWALRLGAATELGMIEPQYCGPAPVPVHRSPIEWLRAGCNGIALLTRNPCEAERILRECGTIEAEDAAHAFELRRLVLLPPYVNTTVIVRSAARRSA